MAAATVYLHTTLVEPSSPDYADSAAVRDDALRWSIALAAGQTKVRPPRCIGEAKTPAINCSQHTTLAYDNRGELLAHETKHHRAPEVEREEGGALQFRASSWSAGQQAPRALSRRFAVQPSTLLWRQPGPQFRAAWSTAARFAHRSCPAGCQQQQQS